jgi:hypothetical protein
MKPGLAWTLALFLTAGSLYLLFIYIPGGRSELARRGIRATGTVQLKDSRPSQDGGLIYTITFIFADSMKKNHRVERRAYDLGLWDRLKVNQDIRIYYLPENPEVASFEGGELMSSPASGSLRYIAWSALIASLYFWYQVYRHLKSPRSPGSPPPAKKPKITRTR